MNIIKQASKLNYEHKYEYVKTWYLFTNVKINNYLFLFENSKAVRYII